MTDRPPGGRPSCPGCNGSNVSLRSANDLPDGVRRQVWYCRDCRRRFNRDDGERVYFP